MARTLPPQLARVEFVTDNEDPVKLWEDCVAAQKKWDNQLSSNKEVKRIMERYAKNRAVNFIWMCNELEDTLPEGVTQSEVCEALTEVYDSDEVQGAFIDGPTTKGKRSDTYIKSAYTRSGVRRQLVQHLQAYKLLCHTSTKRSSLPELTADLIKQVHGVMMQGLKMESGDEVHAGVYRQIPVHAGDHAFPDYECVPEGVSKIVADYNKAALGSHDPFQLASWLHYKVVSLHPFEDGNGRLSRLLSCYSLMQDGVPFAVPITSGHRRAQKHLVWCLKRDRHPTVTNQPHLTTLTIVSVARAWENFLYNLDNFELPGILSTYK